MSDLSRTITRAQEEASVALGEIQKQAAAASAIPVASIVPVPDELGPLTKEQAMADTLRALKDAYPDRWERVWAALGKESASDRAVTEIAKAAAASPTGAVGALIGGLIGAALGDPVTVQHDIRTYKPPAPTPKARHR